MSLKTAVVMEHFNLGYKVWLWGIYLMCLIKKVFSALEIQLLVGYSRYESIWLMLHKICISMSHKYGSYVLEDYIEMDEGFFEMHRKKNTIGAEIKLVKELDRQVKAIVAVSTKPLAATVQKDYHPNTKCGFVKINVVASLCTNEVVCEATKMINKSAKLLTDVRPYYNGSKDICAANKTGVVKDKTKVTTVLPWVHIAIGNAKKKQLDLHHQVKNDYIQNYLNELCYKFNRRYFGIKIFDRLLVPKLSNPLYKSFPNGG